MILYFRRPDGAIITRELGDAAGVKVGVSLPAGAVPIEADVALAALERLEADRRDRRAVEARAYAEARRGAFDELVALGLSTAAAGALSGHRRPVDADRAELDPLAGRRTAASRAGRE